MEKKYLGVVLVSVEIRQNPEKKEKTSSGVRENRQAFADGWEAIFGKKEIAQA